MLHHSLRNVMSFISGGKRVTKIKVGSPHNWRVTCVRLLTGWVNGSCQMPLAVSMVWREPKAESSDCRFCLTNIAGISSKREQTVKLTDVPSAMRSGPHTEEFPVPQPPDLTFTDSEEGHGQQRGKF